MTTNKGYVKETCVDSNGFFTWFVLAFQDDPSLLRKLINPNDVRKGSLPPAARDSFYEKERVVKPHHERQALAIPLDELGKAKVRKELREAANDR